MIRLSLKKIVIAAAPHRVPPRGETSEMFRIAARDKMRRPVKVRARNHVPVM